MQDAIMQRVQHAITVDDDMAALPVARHAAAEWLVDRRVGAGLRDDVLLVLTELVANAVALAAGPVTVAMSVGDDGLRLLVTNPPADSTLPPPDTWEDPGPEGDRGRGLAIVRRLCPMVTVSASLGGTEVECRWPSAGGEDLVETGEAEQP
jgi:anti-sigma regulatory factor (Ser/Thr protein kinase)